MLRDRSRSPITAGAISRINPVAAFAGPELRGDRRRHGLATGHGEEPSVPRARGDARTSDAARDHDPVMKINHKVTKTQSYKRLGFLCSCPSCLRVLVVNSL